MNRSVRYVPLSFIRDRRPVTWPLLWMGVREGWVPEADVIDFAVAKLEEGDEREAVVELASLFSHEEDEVPELLERLAEDEGYDEKDMRLAWLRLLLAWIYENREQLSDPLGIIEGLYADFGYPEEIRELVRYTPPSNGSRPWELEPEQRTRRLIELWRSYLAEVFPSQGTPRIE